MRDKFELFFSSGVAGVKSIHFRTYFLFAFCIGVVRSLVRPPAFQNGDPEKGMLYSVCLAQDTDTDCASSTEKVVWINGTDSRKRRATDLELHLSWSN